MGCFLEAVVLEAVVLAVPRRLSPPVYSTQWDALLQPPEGEQWLEIHALSLGHMWRLSSRKETQLSWPWCRLLPFKVRRDWKWLASPGVPSMRQLSPCGGCLGAHPCAVPVLQMGPTWLGIGRLWTQGLPQPHFPTALGQRAPVLEPRTAPGCPV